MLCLVADKDSTCSSSKEPPKLALWPLYLQTATNSKLERGGVRCSYSVAKFQNLNQVSARMNLSSPLGGLRTRAGPNPPLPNRTNQKCWTAPSLQKTCNHSDLKGKHLPQHRGSTCRVFLLLCWLLSQSQV